MPRAPATYVPIVAPPYNWTGFYIGGNLGGAFTNGNFTTNIPGSTVTTTSSTSFIGGGQVVGVLLLRRLLRRQLVVEVELRAVHGFGGLFGLP